MRFNIQTELESDGRWIAEIPGIPGAIAYGKTEKEAKVNAYAIGIQDVESRSAEC